ncbi:hypothetical protein OOT00_02035 [Desulfobotulus sp. H1]|uniref:Uncharacterized protein n=1 Tax=Desulfobotulus pelophilus TaxID=2823377 RepID=A0ABT3N5M2_9BACT|nr:hypothetical protein [Desulfobotulus pelophilus]MCW7752763.1 hypothetical protein [Desulfobotulus pelophilus]
MECRWLVMLLCIVAGSFVCSDLAAAEEIPVWRLADRQFHREDRRWQEADQDPEAQWRRQDRFFFNRDDAWKKKQDASFGKRDRQWMRKERTL